MQSVSVPQPRVITTSLPGRAARPTARPSSSIDVERAQPVECGGWNRLSCHDHDGFEREAPDADVINRGWCSRAGEPRQMHLEDSARSVRTAVIRQSERHLVVLACAVPVTGVRAAKAGPIGSARPAALWATSA
jgi:hypothetical protein